MSMAMISNAERGMMNRIQKLYAAKGYPKTKVQPFEIRVENELLTSQSSFQWDFKRRATQTKRENSLSDNDSFVLLYMAIGIMKVDNTLTGNYDRGGNSQIYFYPDKNVFSAAATAANVAEFDALRAIWNGYLAMKSNTEEVLFSLETHRFMKTPRTQFSATTDPSYDGEEYQEIPMPIIFEGQKTNEFTLQYAPQADTVQLGGALADTTHQNRLVILHRGLVIRNASEPAMLDMIRQEGLAV